MQSTSQIPSLSSPFRKHLADRSRCTGKLKWSSADVQRDHLICFVSELVSAEYLTILRNTRGGQGASIFHVQVFAKALQLYSHL